MLEFIRRHPGIKANEIAVFLDMAQRTVERLIKELRDAGLVVFVGAPKTGGYYVTEDDT